MLTLPGPQDLEFQQTSILPEAGTFVNAFVNAGFGNVKLMVTKGAVALLSAVRLPSSIELSSCRPWHMGMSVTLLQNSAKSAQFGRVIL